MSVSQWSLGEMRYMQKRNFSSEVCYFQKRQEKQCGDSLEPHNLLTIQIKVYNSTVLETRIVVELFVHQALLQHCFVLVYTGFNPLYL